MSKDEKLTYQEKSDFYHSKKTLLEERIKLLEAAIGNYNDPDLLRLNAYKMEKLEAEASLEGITSYYNHYMNRLMAIDAKEKEITKECQERFKQYYDVFTSISPANLKQHSTPIQEQYAKVMEQIDKEWDQKNKNALYSLMKDLLTRMKKI